MELNIIGHNFMHIVIAVLAGILFIVSLLAYIRTKRNKFMFICGAFLIFSIKETILAVNIIAFGTDPLMMLTHFLDLVILTLFALGIFR
ncbi:TPA: hypothetical protein HA246_04695 [Candidatus Woesearchaeota archaeon]|nr:hypothetical protein [Candidatus Woesearchaeota archaeon]